MDNEFIIQRQADHTQKYLLAQLAAILNLKAPSRVKVQLVEGYLAVLREKQQAEKEKIRENMSTSFSENQSNFTAYEHEVDQLEEKILEKRVRKFQLNQEIEGAEEDLFQVEKTVDTKRDYDDSLRRKIEQKMLQVEKSQGRTPEKSYLNKSLGAVSGMLKGWLY